MQEFSALTGLSRPTVSKYFQDPQSVRRSTRDKIEAAMRAYDYRPSFLATNQNRSNPRTIGMIVPEFSDPFYAELVRRVELRCYDRGYTAITLSSHGSPEIETRAIELLCSLNIGGIILSPLGVASDATAIRRLTHAVPLLMLDSYIEGADAVLTSDNRQGISDITDYLCDTGTAPCYLEMPAVNSTAVERTQAYRAAMTTRGFAPMVVANPHGGWDFEEQGRTIARAAFAGGGFPSTTLLCASDRFAFGVLTTAYEMGIAIGPNGSLRVAGHDNYPLSEFTCPRLTTMEQDFAGLAGRATEIIIEMMEGGHPEQRHQRLPSRLIRRTSA